MFTQFSSYPSDILRLFHSLTNLLASMATISKPVKKFSAKAKPKIKLTDLDEDVYTALIAQAREFIKKKNQPRGGEPIKIAHNNQIHECGHLICLLSPTVRFSIMGSDEVEVM